MESIYWVFTHRCNQHCKHCYNHSGPGGPSVSYAEAATGLENLPRMNRLILSGGEPLAEKALLLFLLRGAQAKFGDATKLELQTNGDLLDAAALDTLLSAGIRNISISSQDSYHARRDGLRARLTELLTSRGLVEVRVGDPTEDESEKRTFSFWGATPDLWLGGLWPRGRALRNHIWKQDPEHNFCSLWSGAAGFLDDGSRGQEIAIQLTSAYPCCPGTVEALGDISEEPLLEILERHRGKPAWESLNRGEPWTMGAHVGVDPTFARARIRELGSVCLWCDEFFTKYRPDGAGCRNEAAQGWPDRELRGRRRARALPSTGKLDGDA